MHKSAGSAGPSADGSSSGLGGGSDRNTSAVAGGYSMLVLSELTLHSLGNTEKRKHWLAGENQPWNCDY